MGYARRPNKHVSAMRVGGLKTVASWIYTQLSDGPGTTTPMQRGQTSTKKVLGTRRGEVTSSKTRRTRNSSTSSHLRLHTAVDLQGGDRSAPSSGPSQRQGPGGPTRSRRHCSGHSTITRRPSTAQQMASTCYTVSAGTSTRPTLVSRRSSITPSRSPARRISSTGDR